MYGVQAITITESEFPVWYPYLGTWFVGIPCEMVLLALANISRGPTTVLHFLLTLTKTVRLAILLLLPFLYYRLRTDPKKFEEDDAERQALLASSKGTYGATKNDDSSDDDDEQPWIIRQRKDEAEMQKRLEKEGNWWSYAKSFTVGVICTKSGLQLTQLPRSLCHLSGHSIIGSSRLGLSLSGCVFCVLVY